MIFAVAVLIYCAVSFGFEMNSTSKSGPRPWFDVALGAFALGFLFNNFYE